MGRQTREEDRLADEKRTVVQRHWGGDRVIEYMNKSWT